ncbi:AAA family ATPase [Paludibaculum fermentans]|uniref:AAA family ATPase n=1 Tax=Paludibaculum fermentans TaxID=1473598 RepID=A0A7S7NP92_PALFE|nr:AAA family ATPase [Paludibaculum fermentans]QOY87272.1 AAA family ATPase [Paludibaculum fermentans]
MRLLILVGLPASGKSTWAQQNGLPVLSSDAVRELLTGDPTHQGVNRLVFRTLRQLAAARAQAGMPVTCIDSTALTVWERRCWVRFAQLHHCTPEVIYFDIPLEECKRRNAARTRTVPDHVMDWMAARLQQPAVLEGFERITIVRQEPGLPASSSA